MYLCAKDLYEAKYQLLINKWEITGWKNLNNFNALIKYSNDIDDIYKNLKKYNANKEMIANMLSNKNLINSKWIIYQR